MHIFHVGRRKLTPLGVGLLRDFKVPEQDASRTSPLKADVRSLRDEPGHGKSTWNFTGAPAGAGDAVAVSLLT